MKIKVCHISTLHSSKDTRIFHKECVSLVKAGFDVTLLVVNQTNEVIKGVNIISLQAGGSNRIRKIGQRLKAVYKKALELDAAIYHFHDPELLLLAKRLKRKGKVVIYDVHEDVPRQILSKPWIPKMLRGLVSSLFERYENQVARQLDGIATATPFIKERFLKINPNTISVCNYPILGELDKVTSWDDKSLSICYIGGISEVRGIKELLQALPKTKATLNLAGWFLSEVLEQEVKQMQVWEQVQYWGLLDRIGVGQVLDKSQIGIVTLHPIVNYLDALPVKLFEYMAAGIPVIASNFKLWQAIVEKHDCGLCVDPLNPNDIATAINQLLTNPTRAQEMGKRGQEAVYKYYTWQKEADKLIHLYEKISSI